MCEENTTLERASILIGSGLVSIGISELIKYEPISKIGLMILGLYLVYRGFIEFTTDKKGISMPNAFRVIICALILVTILFIFTISIWSDQYAIINIINNIQHFIHFLKDTGWEIF